MTLTNLSIALQPDGKYLVRGPASLYNPLGLYHTFPNMVELVEWLKSSDDYRNAQWIRGKSVR